MNNNIFDALPGEIRRRCRNGSFTGTTAGLAAGYTQANLVILPGKYASEFTEFCRLNPKPCPLIEVTDKGSFQPLKSAPGADLRTDLPLYKIYRNGKLTEETVDIKKLWKDDFVSFLLGCSFTFEHALENAGIPIRHIEEKCIVPMYRTNIDCIPASRFKGKLIVSMRPVPKDRVADTIEITNRYLFSHGAPVHCGNPEKIGIIDLQKTDYGNPVTIKKNEIPLFWACGVTPQEAILEAKPEIAITHAPGHMFVTDLKDEDIEENS